MVKWSTSSGCVNGDGDLKTNKVYDGLWVKPNMASNMGSVDQVKIGRFCDVERSVKIKHLYLQGTDGH